MKGISTVYVMTVGYYVTLLYVHACRGKRAMGGMQVNKRDNSCVLKTMMMKGGDAGDNGK